ncbi:MAG: DUF3883 domain-containing protein [Acholeplasmatales bacterium]|nr:DUF3883 domain-containing protein [Acholeplasmatales bacterium]
MGRNSTSHQTHIGLFDDVLTFLPNQIEIEDAFLIFDGNYQVLPVFFDRIQNPDGTFRSPKIRTGSGRGDSVVSVIKKTAASMDINLKWYLFWFGLDSERPVFFIFNNASSTYNDIINLGLELPNGVKNRLNSSSPIFNSLINYIVKVVNDSAEDFIEELEVLVQVDPVSVPKRYRRYDIEQAMVAINQIGKNGEKIINNYLYHLLELGEIKSYKWENEEKEGGLPYDFYFVDLNDKVIYLDVKTTNHKFNQKMIFSSQEAEFISGSRNNYCIYRVYKEKDGNYSLKICENARHLFKKIHGKTVFYRDSLDTLACVEGIKLSVSPLQNELIFDTAISLENVVKQG